MKTEISRYPLVIMTVIWCLATNDMYAAYEEVLVQNGGTVIGTVRYDGSHPKRKKLPISSTDKICHKKPIPNDDMVVSKEDGGIRWAVVSIKKIDRGKSVSSNSDQPVILDQRGCRFRPHVVVVTKDQTLNIRNSDNILHNVHVYSKKNQPFNRSMPGVVKELDVTFNRTERVRVGCDVHRWMGAWIVVAKHPYHAVTKKDGSFRLDDVPPGTYTLEVWHEKLGKQTQEVTVQAGTDSIVEFILKGK